MLFEKRVIRASWMLLRVGKLDGASLLYVGAFIQGTLIADWLRVVDDVLANNNVGRTSRPRAQVMSIIFMRRPCPQTLTVVIGTLSPAAEK